jgi:GT2 family glycosyltransferase
MNDSVSIVVTSCGRFDLLYRTLESFFKFNSYRNVSQLIVIDDSGHSDVARDILEKMLGSLRDTLAVEIIINDENLGQVKSIDLAYSRVTNSLIFHLEDDWEFYRQGFIEHSYEILAAYPWIVTVWLRAHTDTMGHPIEFVDHLPFGLLTLNYLRCYHGFTWNPGLRREKDYRLIQSFSEHAPGEGLAGIWYMRNGFRAAMSCVKEGFVRHIGWERSTASMPGTKKA